MLKGVRDTKIQTCVVVIVPKVAHNEKYFRSKINQSLFWKAWIDRI